jgi:hypothetical protein
MAGSLRSIRQVSHLTRERPEPQTEDPAMHEHTTHVACVLHQDSINAAWLFPGAITPDVRTIPPEPTPVRRLVKEILS